MKILLTGSGGYIGSLAARRLLDAGFEVIGVDSCLRGFRQPMDLLQQEFGENRFRYYQADIRSELEPIFEKEKGPASIFLSSLNPPFSFISLGRYFGCLISNF